MKILFVSCNFPHDLKTFVSGLDRRMAMFIEALKGLGELDMLFYVPFEFRVDAGRRQALENELASHWRAKLRLTICTMPSVPKRRSLWGTYGPGALSFYRQSLNEGVSGPEQVRALRNCLERGPDAIFVHRLRSMCPLLLAPQRIVPVFLDLDYIEHVAFARSIHKPPYWISKPLRYLQLPALIWGERKAIRRANKTFVCSEKDHRYLYQVLRLPGISTIPNAVPIPVSTSVPDTRSLLFLGIHSYSANSIAAEHLIRNIWPRVRRACPDARLIIAGKGPQHIPSYKERPEGVDFRGFVENLDELYRDTRVVCCPIQSGGGTRFKIVEAAAYGRPIVASSIGAEGLAMRDGDSILLRDDPESFAQACVLLLKDNQLAAKLGDRARQEAIRAYDKNSIVTQITNEIRACLDSAGV